MFPVTSCCSFSITCMRRDRHWCIGISSHDQLFYILQKMCTYILFMIKDEAAIRDFISYVTFLRAFLNKLKIKTAYKVLKRAWKLPLKWLQLFFSKIYLSFYKVLSDCLQVALKLLKKCLPVSRLLSKWLHIFSKI